MVSELRLIGMDPSLNNWGIAVARYNPFTRDLRIESLSVVQPDYESGKTVRKNCQDIERAKQLFQGAVAGIQGAHAAFVEVPVGSQSARAMASYGICVGVLGALRAQQYGYFEVTPSEVKLKTVGDKTASKQQMISWAMRTHPEASWPMVTRKGHQKVNESTAEHMADAIGAIYAGIELPAFQQLLTMLSNH